MVNYVLALLVMGLAIVYMIVELGWGGGRETWRPSKPILWIRWRRIGLYPPEPRDDTPKRPRPVKPKTPESVS